MSMNNGGFEWDDRKAAGNFARHGVGFAAARDVPYFGVYVNGAGTASTLPTGLARNRTIDWQWAKIADAIKQMLTESKNKK